MVFRAVCGRPSPGRAGLLCGRREIAVEEIRRPMLDQHQLHAFGNLVCERSRGVLPIGPRREGAGHFRMQFPSSDSFSELNTVLAFKT